MRDGRMHQTTIRFSPDLWDSMEEECSTLGVSVAQFLREAALARLAYAAGRRRDAEYAAAYSVAGAAVVEPVGPVETAEGDADAPTPHAPSYAGGALQAATERLEAAAAVHGQSELVWRRSRDLRGQAVELRRQRRVRKE